tara:strand:- start:65129 stop:65737 length:609 start_codon:yes stop_codon:yes gene_type:complete
MHTTTLFQGFFVGAGLIMAIGAQNAFVLKQGLKGNHLLLTAITCCICDGVLIALGVLGIGLMVQDHANWLTGMRWLGAIFLTVYSILSFIKVFKPEALATQQSEKQNNSKIATLLALLGFTLLNPHTYIDTFVLLGGIGAQHCGLDKYLFIAGTLSASIMWFFGLTYGAARLTPLFQNPKAWQVLNAGIGFMMLFIAFKLIF